MMLYQMLATGNEASLLEQRPSIGPRFLQPAVSADRTEAHNVVEADGEAAKDPTRGVMMHIVSDR